jgi:hypothetical protein
VRKKIFLSIIASFVIFTFFPKTTLAACKKTDTCTTFACTADSKAYCCDTAEECTNLEQNFVANPTVRCDKVDGNFTGVETAIGCVHVLATPEVFLGEILGWAVGVGGGIAFLLILYAGFMIMTASGSPERLKAGQELLTSAISGLILLILSIFILKFIGIDILGLGKLGFGA